MSGFKKILEKIDYEHIVLAVGAFLTSLIIITAN